MNTVEHPVRAGATRGKAFTMVELLVTTAVLAIFMLAAGKIMTSSQLLVETSEAIMRSNAQAAAIARALRTDIRAASQHGFLCIAQGSGGTPQLFVSDAEVAYSLLRNVKGSGSVLGYGMCSDGGAGRVFWRAKWITTEAMAADDVFRLPIGENWRLLDFADVQLWKERATASSAVDAIRSYIAPATLNVPVRDIPDVMKVWQVLSAECTRLDITWTRGETDTTGNLKWYGVVGNASQSAGDSSVEVSTSPYKAIWTNDNQHNWPTAVRFSFDLTDKIVKVQQLRSFDVVCPIGQ